jgi:hypothetical protein
VSWTFFKHHAVQYPTISRIARDYLAIQGSAVPSERAFSSGGLTATVRRNRLSGDIFEALQILKSGYRNGHISASEQAEAHFAAYIEELAYLEVDDDMPALE